MKSSMLPEFPRLQGEEAIEALHNFIKDRRKRQQRFDEKTNQDFEKIS